MEKAITIPEKVSQLQADFISTEAFREMMASRKSPYECKFSLSPFIEHIKGKLQDSNRDETAVIWQLVDQIEQQMELFSDEEAFEKNKDKLEPFLAMLFPALFFEGQKGFISVPFSNEFMFVTPELEKLLFSGEWEMKVPDFLSHDKDEKPSFDIANLILKNFYDLKMGCMSFEVLAMRNKKTGLDKFYKINLIEDFVKGVALKPPKKLTQKQLHQMFDKIDDTEYWMEHLPPENFAFEGIVIGFLQDVTDVETLSLGKAILVDDQKKDHEHLDELAEIQQLTRSFLERPEIEIGMIHTYKHLWQESTSWNLLRFFDISLIAPSLSDPKCGYGKVLAHNKPVILADLGEEEYLSELEKTLLDKGVKCLLLAPMYANQGEIIGVFEMSSPHPYAFSTFTLMQIKELINLFAIGTNKFISELENNTRLTIQQQFTSIHSSVEWKFREAATKFYWQQNVERSTEDIDPIVFKDLYPIYGQADIVGSSKIRNKAIIADLTDNLERVIEVMNACQRQLTFHLLDVYLMKARNNYDRLCKGDFVSSDETQIVELLTMEIHPLLKELSTRYSEIPKKEISSYFKHLDPNLDIIYRHRKDYEDSVSILNNTIAKFVEAEDHKMQKILPHYFEKYTTDGVEYNIYLGQSLLPDTTFSQFYLKDFRLWQLIKMVEITRLVWRTSAELPVPLQTAQLIFVYNNTMSIRFNMDEKQFDVDGTYNVRYEILKKRIDKAVIKGTGERLTVKDKIAIVWLQDKDRQEYMEYLYHLIEKGMISEDIEEVELEKLQGAEGLKALRVSVIQE